VVGFTLFPAKLRFLPAKPDRSFLLTNRLLMLLLTGRQPKLSLPLEPVELVRRQDLVRAVDDL
jgi:hypothetical protein